MKFKLESRIFICDFSLQVSNCLKVKALLSTSLTNEALLLRVDSNFKVDSFTKFHATPLITNFSLHRFLKHIALAQRSLTFSADVHKIPSFILFGWFSEIHCQYCAALTNYLIVVQFWRRYFSKHRQNSTWYFRALCVPSDMNGLHLTRQSKPCHHCALILQFF